MSAPWIPPLSLILCCSRTHITYYEVGNFPSRLRSPLLIPSRGNPYGQNRQPFSDPASGQFPEPIVIKSSHFKFLTPHPFYI